MKPARFDISPPPIEIPLWCRVCLVLMGITTVVLPSQSASASQDPPIALLNFTIRRASAEDVQSFSQNLRESFMLDTRFSLLDELDMYHKLLGKDGSRHLREARTLLADGKRSYRNGKYEESLEKLEAARAIHRRLFSELSRADEMADLMLYHGLCQYRMNQHNAAKVSFLQMYLLYPDIEVESLPGINSEIMGLLAAARKLEDVTPLRGLATSFAADIARKLNVSYLMTGVVEGPSSGASTKYAITVQVTAPGHAQPLTTMIFDWEDLGFGIPPAGSPIYQKIIAISARALGEPA